MVESLSNVGKGGRFSEFVASVEKYMGIAIDLNNITVDKFYSYVKLMEKEIKAMEANKNG